MEIKKQLIVGAILIASVSCFLLELMSSIFDNLSYLPSALSGGIASIIAVIGTIYALAFVLIGIWGFLRPPPQLEELNKRFTLTASIPGLFLLSLMPIFFGIVLVVLTKQTTWGFCLSALSLPSLLLFLTLALRKNT